MKRLYLIALFALVCGGASAQENGNRDAQNRVVRGPYETNRLSDNIFVGIAGGINLYFGEHDSQGKFGKRLAPALDIHVGKWFTPSIGARVGYTGLQAKGRTTAGTMYAKKQDGLRRCGFRRRPHPLEWLPECISPLPEPSQSLLCCMRLCRLRRASL